MTRTWPPIVAGGLAVISIAVGVRHCASSEPEIAAPSQQELAALAREANRERGWVARPDPLDSGDEGNLSQATRQQPGGGAAIGDQSRRRAGGDADSGTPGEASVLHSRARSRSGVRHGGRSGSRTSGSIEVAGLVPLEEEPFEGARPMGRRGREQIEVREFRDALEGDTLSETEDDGGPVFSLPLEDFSSLPEESELAPVIEEGVTFDTGDGAYFSSDSQFVIPNAGNIKGEAGTISFWLQPDWEGDDGSDASFVQLRERYRFENRIQITKNGHFLRFIFADNTGHESGAGAYINNWQPGERHLVTATWGEALTTLYVDGRPVGQQTYTGELEISPGTPLYIGSDYKGDQPGASGVLSQFQVYNRALAPDEVAQLSSHMPP